MGCCGCWFQGGQLWCVGPLGSQRPFHGSQAWAATVAAAFRRHLPGTPLLLDLRPSTRALKVIPRSLEASSRACSTGSGPLGLCRPAPNSQDSGPQPLLWNILDPHACLLTCTAALPVAKRCVPERLVREPHSERAAPPAVPRTFSRGVVGEHGLELGGLCSVGPAETGERGREGPEPEPPGSPGHPPTAHIPQTRAGCGILTTTAGLC